MIDITELNRRVQEDYARRATLNSLADQFIVDLHSAGEREFALRLIEVARFIVFLNSDDYVKMLTIGLEGLPLETNGTFTWKTVPVVDRQVSTIETVCALEPGVRARLPRRVLEHLPAAIELIHGIPSEVTFERIWPPSTTITDTTEEERVERTLAYVRAQYDLVKEEVALNVALTPERDLMAIKDSLFFAKKLTA